MSERERWLEMGEYARVRIGGMWHEGKVIQKRKDGFVKLRFAYNCCRFGLDWGWFAPDEVEPIQ